MTPEKARKILQDILAAMIKAAGEVRGIAVVVVRDSTNNLHIETRSTPTQTSVEASLENLLFSSITTWGKHAGNTRIFCTFIGGSSGDVHEIQRAGYEAFQELKQ